MCGWEGGSPLKMSFNYPGGGGRFMVNMVESLLFSFTQNQQGGPKTATGHFYF